MAVYQKFLLNEDALQKQLESISFMYQYYHTMPIFVNCNIEDIKNGFLSLVIYPANYFFIHQVTALTLWKNIFEISYYLEKSYVEKTFLLIEIGLFVPQSNAALERFFSQLRYVKSNLHTSLSLQSLNALLHFQVIGPSLHLFHEQHAKNVINFWYNSKEQRIYQPKKSYARTAQVAKPKHVCFDVNELSWSSSSSSSDSEDD